MQAAIIIQFGDTEILVRLQGVHVPEHKVDVDTRPSGTMRSETWRPYNMRLVEVRNEGS